MMTINPYLFFDGNCEEAVKFYAEAFNIEPTIRRYAEASPEVKSKLPKEVLTKVMWAEVKDNDFVIVLSDSLNDESFKKGNNVDICITCESAEEAKEIFSKLAVGGKQYAQADKPAMADFYSKFEDKFGVTWQILASNTTLA